MLGAMESSRPPPDLIVASSRLPLTVRRTAAGWASSPGSGGLVAVLEPLLRGGEARWLGWAGDAPDVDDREAASERARLLRRWEASGYQAVDLAPDIARAFSEGYANDTLWPLLHGFPGMVALDPTTWPAYRAANARFAQAITDHAGDPSVIWIHDFQLMLVPELVRAGSPDATIGFFLHVPFPAFEIFRMLPERELVLRGLLGADLIGFQTYADLHEFRRALQQILGIESRMDQLDVGGRSVRLGVFPIGIVTEEWCDLLAREAVQRRVAELKAQHAGRALVLAVDRLDYTKGIPERLNVFRRLLREDPARHGRVTLVQVAIPTRERIPRYQRLRRRVNELVAEINGEFGTPAWTPVVHLLRPVARPELAALYAAADVAWVSSLRDGMNLVAKEYVACQSREPGALIVSEFAGVAQELGEALRVNPYDEVASAATLARALDMPREERAERMAALQDRVQAGSAAVWRDRYLAALREAARDRNAKGRTESPRLDVPRLVAAVRDGALLCLDYDGTLVPIAPRPEDARPTGRVQDVLRRLGAVGGATSVAILSGRRADDLERWFGRIPGLWLAAEHGAILRSPGSTVWRPLRAGAGGDWKREVRPVLEDFAARLPGSLIEEKGLSIAWHYRLADREFGRWLAQELAATLAAQLANSDLTVLHGRRVVEVRYAWATKGEAYAAIDAELDRRGPVVAIGDDRTDEDLFERLGRDAWTIRVGDGPTAARWSVAGPDDVLDVLEAIADELERTAVSGPEPRPARSRRDDGVPTGPRAGPPRR
jgi:trehalose 6-phosphate synthase/phosphatase